MIRRIDYTIVAIVIAAAALTLFAGAIPNWIRFLLQIAAGVTLVSAGVMILLRAGLLSLGQGLFYFAGGYAAALLNKHFSISDVFLFIVSGALVAALLSAVLTPFIARYRGIFFSMLTLAISMVVYGIATKVHLFGGSDGMNVSLPSYLGYRPRGPEAQFAAFTLCVWTWALMSMAAHIFLSSRFGKVISAVGDNELRVEFLGYSVRRVVSIAYVVAGTLAGVGGALAAISARHVDPHFAYWTTGGDFVFVSLLSGQASILSPAFGAFALEMLRSYAGAMFPDQWQSMFGAIMLAIVMFVPAGLDRIVLMMMAKLPKRSSDWAGLSKEEPAS